MASTARLDENQVAWLRTAMTRRLAALRDSIREETAIEGEQKGRLQGAEVGDFGDEAVGADLVRTEDVLIGLHRAEARELESALDRLSNGRYGLCADCDAPIGYERLRVNLTGKRCQPCQQRYEFAAAAAARRTTR